MGAADDNIANYLTPNFEKLVSKHSTRVAMKASNPENVNSSFCN